MPDRRADAIVVGLGAMGSATILQLARRGVGVIGLDRYRPPHPWGSTHGDTRVTRLAVGEGPEYVPLVRRSHELWREIEAESGARLLTQCGGLTMAQPGSPFFEETQALGERFGIEHERLSNSELRTRLPMFAVDDETEGYYEPEAGYLRPEAAVTVQLELAKRAGASLRFGEEVVDWRTTDGVVTVTTGGGTYVGEQLIICAGPWIAELFPEGRQLFAVHRQLLYWFPILRGYEQLREMPIFVWEFAAGPGEAVHLRGFYGFPAIDGPRGGVKVAAETYEATTTPDGHQHPATESETAAMYRAYVAGQLPWLGPDAVRTVSCLYTVTRGNRFVIDRHPGHDNVVIVSPCSGHGFKHSAAIGEAVAQLITDEAPRVDLSPFSVARLSA